MADTTEYYVRKGAIYLEKGDYWPVMVPSKTSKTGTTMGGPVAYCDNEIQAKQLADLMNQGERVPELERRLAEATAALEAVTKLAEKAANEIGEPTGYTVTYRDGHTATVANIALADHEIRANGGLKYRPAFKMQHAKTD